MRTLAAFYATSLALASAFSPGASAQTAEDERVRITDPAQLIRWGYPPDAAHVYARVGHEAAGASDVRGANQPLGIEGDRFWVTATGFAFHPLSNNGEYVKGPSFLVQNGAVVVTGSERVMEAQFDVPDGSTLHWVDIFGFHNHASHEFVFNTIERCLPYIAAGNPSETVLATTTVTTVGESFRRSQALSHAIDARQCSYHLRAIFGSGGSAPALNMQLSKVRFELSQ